MESVLFALDDMNYKGLYKSLKKMGRMTIGKAKVQTFSDGESGVSFQTSVRGKRVYLITSPNDSNKLIQLGLAIDAAKRASANEIIPIIPYYPYSRQDKMDSTRGSIGSKFVADMLEAAGANTIITFDLHAGQIQGFFNIPVIHLEGRYSFDSYVIDNYLKLGGDWVFAAPDAGSSKRVKQFRDRITELTKIKHPMVHIDKTRESANEVSEMELIGDVTDKHVIIYDDMMDTCGTMVKAAKLIKDHGAKSVRAIATHGVLSGSAYERIETSVLDEVVVSNTLPIEKSKKIKIVSCHDQISNAILAINECLSIEDLKNS